MAWGTRKTAEPATKSASRPSGKATKDRSGKKPLLIDDKPSNERALVKVEQGMVTHDPTVATADSRQAGGADLFKVMRDGPSAGIPLGLGKSITDYQQLLKRYKSQPDSKSKKRPNAFSEWLEFKYNMGSQIIVKTQPPPPKATHGVETNVDHMSVIKHDPYDFQYKEFQKWCSEREEPMKAIALQFQIYVPRFLRTLLQRSSI